VVPKKADSSKRPKVMYHVHYRLVGKGLPEKSKSCAVTCLQLREHIDYEWLRELLATRSGLAYEEVLLVNLSPLYTYPFAPECKHDDHGHCVHEDWDPRRVQGESHGWVCQECGKIVVVARSPSPYVDG